MGARASKAATDQAMQPDIIRFETGILGFEAVKEYRLVSGDGPFRILQAEGVPDLGFVVTDPWLFRPDYAPEIWEDDETALELTAQDRVDVWVIVTLAKDPQAMTANLQAPLVVNARTGAARQVVQREGAYGTRHRLGEELERARALGLLVMRRPSEAAPPRARLVMNGRELAQAPLAGPRERQADGDAAPGPRRRSAPKQAPLGRRG